LKEVDPNLKLKCIGKVKVQTGGKADFMSIPILTNKSTAALFWIDETVFDTVSVGFNRRKIEKRD